MPLEVGAPDAAFAGGPIRLTKAAVARLREHYHGDKVPIVPLPLRRLLDTALHTQYWAGMRAALAKARDPETALVWEQTRFIATGGLEVAEQHARDLAATGASGIAETAAMLWLYAAAVIFVDGRRCTGPTGPDAHMEELRGPDHEPVIRIIRAMTEERLSAMRTLALRLEEILASDRDGLAPCRTGDAPPETKPEEIWRPDAAAARAMLPAHLTELTAAMRPAQPTPN
jgi:hypothetical protein